MLGSASTNGLNCSSTLLAVVETGLDRAVDRFDQFNGSLLQDQRPPSGSIPT